MVVYVVYGSRLCCVCVRVWECVCPWSLTESLFAFASCAGNRIDSLRNASHRTTSHRSDCSSAVNLLLQRVPAHPGQQCAMVHFPFVYAYCLASASSTVASPHPSLSPSPATHKPTVALSSQPGTISTLAQSPN